ncbi:sigma 54 modulation/S30EA ribosomal C-terminal domain-containing protein [Miltoncostaea marina]|uniref:sigma 54 modulation/S30EA ribosomal C-terminal domain-containing protein n=1 Tax=Miltoncostaea marina TaxID=2843215 RepID=UPI001C3E3841|nr:sigma 54 modulation/S30EA ribosomal C-terminal domain-containing protein [Miltoncostaea marina]
MDATQPPTTEPRVRLRGAAEERHRERAVAKLRAACAPAPRPARLLRLDLGLDGDPALERPAVAKATVEVGGRLVRAHVACPTLDQAIDRLADRVGRSIRRLAERRRDRARRAGVAAQASWRHGDPPAERPGWFPRPVADRRLVRRKSFAIARITPEEAADEMVLLDHDFHLFTDAATGADCVIHRTEGGELGLLSPEPEAGRGPAGEPAELVVAPARRLPLSDALTVLDESATPFVAFVDAERDRLMVAYRRYDGHYGLLGPSDAW